MGSNRSFSIYATLGLVGAVMIGKIFARKDVEIISLCNPVTLMPERKVS